MKEAHVRSYLALLGSPSGFDYVRKRTPLKMTRGVERTMSTKNFTRSKVFWRIFVKYLCHRAQNIQISYYNERVWLSALPTGVETRRATERSEVGSLVGLFHSPLVDLSSLRSSVLPACARKTSTRFTRSR